MKPRRWISAWFCVCASILASAEEPAPDAGSPVQLKREYQIVTDTYSVEVDHSGMLMNLRRNDAFVQMQDGKVIKSEPAPQTPLIACFSLGEYNANAGAPVLTSLSATGKNEISAVYASPLYEGRGADRVLKETMGEAYVVTYGFDRNEIKVKIRAKHGFQNGFMIDPTAQIAELTAEGREATLPALKGFGAGFEWRFTYADGTEVLFRHNGPHNDFQEHGSIEGPSGLSWRRVRLPPNYDYTMVFRILPGQRNQKVLSSPSFDVTTPYRAHVFFRQEEKQFQLLFKRNDYQKILDNGVTDTEIEYRITDHLGREIAKGSTPIDFKLEGQHDPENGLIKKEVTVAIDKYGYFDANFRIVDKRKQLRGVWVPRRVSVLEAIDSPEVEHAERIGQWEGGWGNDYRRNAFLGLGLEREEFTGRLWDPNKKEGVYDPAKNEYHWEKTDEWLKGQKRKSDQFGVPFHMMMNGCGWAKTPAEQQAFFKAFVSRYKDYVKVWETVNEPTITLRPGEYLEMHLKPLYNAVKEVDPQAMVIAPSSCGWAFEWIEELFKLGGNKYLDGVSLHPYQGMPYDQSFAPLVEQMQRLMAQYGLAGKPIWLTEGGFGWWNLAGQVQCARHNVRRLLIQDQYGIPKEHDMYYFTTAGGYHQFFIVDYDGSLLPQGAALRNNKCRLRGTTFERRLEFNLPFVKGNIYKSADRQVVALWSFDHTRTLPIKSDAATGKLYDMWGNGQEIAAKDGVFACPLSGEPCYLELPPQATVEPILPPLTYNVAQLSLGAEATASSASRPAALALDGLWNGGGWQAATPNAAPDWFEVSLPFPQAINRVILFKANFSDFELKAWSQDKWVTLQQVRGSQDQIHDLVFEPVITNRLRLDIQAGSGSSQIAEFQAFAATGTATDQINWAEAASGGKASASSFWKIGPAEYRPENAIDGKHLAYDWREFAATSWCDGTPGQFPDWLQIDFAGKKKLTNVLVFLAHFGKPWWQPDQIGISDCNVEFWDGQAWKQAGSIAGNKKGVIAFLFKEPIETEKIRLNILNANDGKYSMIMEVQAWGPKDAR